MAMVGPEIVIFFIGSQLNHDKSPFCLTVIHLGTWIHVARENGYVISEGQTWPMKGKSRVKA
jgi:hypothetical protein